VTCGRVLGQNLFVKATSCPSSLLHMLVRTDYKYDIAEHDVWGFRR
jgi:hypothetical protein